MKSKKRKNKVPWVAGLGFCVLVAGAAWAAKTYFFASEVLFCEGQDTNGLLHSIRFAEKGQGSGTVRVYKEEGDHRRLEHEDVKGLIYRAKADAEVSRVSLQLAKDQKLQVYRECGAQPICRFEHVTYLSAEQQAEMKKKADAMERATYERRQQASLAAQEFSKLRKKAIDIKAKLAKAKGAAKKRLAGELKKAEIEAGAAADKLHSLGADTFHMQQQTQAAKKSALESGTQIQTAELKPSQVEQWCGDSARPKMKF